MTGHFTSSDTIIPEPGKAQGYDRYAYVQNNPIRYNDPSGHCPLCVVATVIGGVLIGSAIYSNFIHEPLAPADGNASNVTELMYLSYEHAEHANIIGEALSAVSNDKKFINWEKNHIDKMKLDPRYKIEEFQNSLEFSYTFGEMGNSNMFEDALQSQTWTVRAANVKLNTQVKKSGDIYLSYRVSDVLDLRPDWTSGTRTGVSGFFYNIATSILKPIWHDALGAKDLKTTASWSKNYPNKTQTHNWLFKVDKDEK